MQDNFWLDLDVTVPVLTHFLAQARKNGHEIHAMTRESQHLFSELRIELEAWTRLYSDLNPD